MCPDTEEKENWKAPVPRMVQPSKATEVPNHIPEPPSTWHSNDGTSPPCPGLCCAPLRSHVCPLPQTPLHLRAQPRAPQPCRNMSTQTTRCFTPNFSRGSAGRAKQSRTTNTLQVSQQAKFCSAKIRTFLCLFWIRFRFQNFNTNRADSCHRNSQMHY